MQAALSLRGARGGACDNREGGAVGRQADRVAPGSFPTFTPAEDVLGPLLRRVEEAGIRVMTGTEVEELVPGGVTVGGGRALREMRR